MFNELIPEQKTNSVQQFGEQDARKLVEDMLFMYGKKFTDQWSGLKKGQVIEKFVEKLSGLTYEQFIRGLKRLDTADWPPSIPEFKNWCVGAYEYQSAEQAWLQALDYEKNNRVAEINSIALEAYQEVYKSYGFFGSNDTFFKVFTSVYKRLITEAREVNKTDDLLDAIPQIASSGDDSSHKPVSNELAKKHCAELFAKLNVKNRQVHKPQELKPTPKPLNTPVVNEWPDPFDDAQTYLEQCDSDGHAVPKSIRRQLNGGAA